MRRCVCGRDGVCAARPQARLPRPQPDDSAERDRTQSIGGGLPKDENRSPGALPGVPKQLLSPNRCGFAAARGWPDTYLPVPRQARIRAVWGQCWCVPGSAPSRSMPLGVRWRPKEWLFVNHPILSPKFSQTTCFLLQLLGCKALMRSGTCTPELFVFHITVTDLPS